MGSGGAGAGAAGAGALGEREVWMEGVDVQVGTSGVGGVEVDAVIRFLFNFRDGGRESGREIDMLESGFID